MLPLLLSSQENYNLELVSETLLEDEGSDIWGFVDENGIEYAIIGERAATKIYSLEDPKNPILRKVIQAIPTTWRDYKSWDNFIYGVADQGSDGLLIVDMSGAPENITSKYINVQYDLDGQIKITRSFHNIFIDEFGYAYLVGGSSLGSETAIVLDLNADPENPVGIAAYGEATNPLFRYCHDIFVQNNLMYICETWEGKLSIWDIKDKSNPIKLDEIQTSTDDTHHVWVTPDNKYAFTTDEASTGNLDSYDVSDPNNIKRLDTFRPNATQNSNSSPHNTFYKDGFLYTSWYSDGIIVIDAHQPDNLIEVASFDTYIPDDDSSYNGCWGIYPYLPSGNIIASNHFGNLTQTEEGSLLVFQDSIQPAAYIKGNVYDLETDEPINNAKVILRVEQDLTSYSDIFGDYKSGYATSGQYIIRAEHPDYQSKSGPVIIENGRTTTRNIALRRLPEKSINISFIDSITRQPIKGIISFVNDNRTLNLESDQSGIINTKVFDEEYDLVVAGAWGYKYNVLDISTINENQEITIELTQGYQDDFHFDYNWKVISSNTNQSWQRVIPNPENATFLAPVDDLDNDIGEYCFVTGVEEEQLYQGTTTLISPIINLENYNQPIIKFNRWYRALDDPEAEEFFKLNLVSATNDTTTLLESVKEIQNDWSTLIEIDLTTYNTDLNQTFNLEFVAKNGSELFDYKAAIDGFEIYDALPSSTQAISLEENASFHPNPSSNIFNIDFKKKGQKSIRLYDQNGKIISSIETNLTAYRIEENIPNGIYIVEINYMDGTSEVQKLIKSR